jgi:uncharacterized membrane protein YecN with MAPEG domain
MSLTLLTITPLYVGILALLLVFLSFAVISVRRSARIGIGDGGDKALLRKVRVHGNFVEYVPIALIMMAILEVNQVDNMVLHGLGMALVIGRVLHATGLSKSAGTSPQRFIGTASTFLVIVIEAIYCISFAF